MISNQLPIFRFLVQLSDDAMILSQRLSEWCGHGPVLEQDIALTNIALDILGQARLWYQLASEHTEDPVDEDSLAYRRDAREFTNIILVEQPNGDWGQTVLRQYLYDTFKKMYYASLSQSSNATVAEIAHKCLVETTYHHKWSSEWVKRLGLGTEESNTRMQHALDRLWRYHHELTIPDGVDLEMAGSGIAPDPGDMKEHYSSLITDHLIQCGLRIPADQTVITGGRKGIHSEHLGYILAEMQYLQRVYPNLEW